MQKWIAGMNCLRLGCRDLLQPGIRLFVIFPLLINILIFGALFYFGFHYSVEKLSFLSNYTLPHWLSWLQGVVALIQYLLMIVIFIVLFVVFSLLATLGANILACPFNGMLSEALSKILGEQPPKSVSFVTLMGTSLMRELRKMRYYLPKAILIGLGFFVLQFIPPLNFITPFIFYWFSAWVMAIQYIDYPADNFHVSFPNLLETMKKQKSICLGFGLGVALLSAVPFLNLFVMPAAVLGATRLWHMVNKGQ